MKQDKADPILLHELVSLAVKSLITLSRLRPLFRVVGRGIQPFGRLTPLLIPAGEFLLELVFDDLI